LKQSTGSKLEGDFRLAVDVRYLYSATPEKFPSQQRIASPPSRQYQ